MAYIRINIFTNPTSYRGLITKIQKVILKISSNYERDGVPTGHLSSPNETSSTGTKLYTTELLVKWIPWKSPNNPVGFQINLLPSPKGQQGLFLKTTPTWHWIWRSWVRAYIEPSASSSVCYRKVLVDWLLNKNAKHQHKHKAFALKSVCVWKVY